MMRQRSIAALVWALAACACRNEPLELAPPPASYELVVAPPGARGARAAGTDAAPPPPGEGELAEPGEDQAPEVEADPETDAGVDGQPDAAPGVAFVIVQSAGKQ